MTTEIEANRGELRDQRAVLADFGRLALEANSLQDILQEACRLVSRGLDADLVKVMELHSDDGTLLIRAGVGWKEGIVGHLTIPVEPGSSETRAIDTGEPFVCLDVEGEHQFTIPDFIREHGVRSLVNVPILGSGRKPPYGILQVDSRRLRAFSRSDIDFLRGYANLLASSVERLNLLPELQAAVEEKNRLFRELQHRMKNNLQVITGLIAIQSANARTLDARRELHSIGNRIEAMRLVQDKLHSAGEVDRIDLGIYLGELSASLLRFQGNRDRSIRLRTEVESVIMVPGSLAMPLGLIVNEFVTNSLKYAFGNGNGIIGVKLEQEGQHAARLSLWDNGKGLPKERHGTGAGMMLIEGLAGQIEANAVWNGDGGTRLTIEFKLRSGGNSAVAG
ncbi:sensor histidine kinase [Azospirillum halopraeferens]|uniref:sensor histidine kinase n=1 Tax=Azospirillum halopraeferens TaxID=34010 RepID=UPI00048BCD67|nr:histidine kinase dimerization/phosphoacceptor domain -containing protein [Azospirillum halopraeferens]